MTSPAGPDDRDGDHRDRGQRRGRPEPTGAPDRNGDGHADPADDDRCHRELPAPRTRQSSGPSPSDRPTAARADRLRLAPQATPGLARRRAAPDHGLQLVPHDRELPIREVARILRQRSGLLVDPDTEHRRVKARHGVQIDGREAELHLHLHHIGEGALRGLDLRWRPAGEQLCVQPGLDERLARGELLVRSVPRVGNQCLGPVAGPRVEVPQEQLGRVEVRERAVLVREGLLSVEPRPDVQAVEHGGRSGHGQGPPATSPERRDEAARGQREEARPLGAAIDAVEIRQGVDPALARQSLDERGKVPRVRAPRDGGGRDGHARVDAAGDHRGSAEVVPLQHPEHHCSRERDGGEHRGSVRRHRPRQLIDDPPHGSRTAIRGRGRQSQVAEQRRELRLLIIRERSASVEPGADVQAVERVLVAGYRPRPPAPPLQGPHEIRRRLRGELRALELLDRLLPVRVRQLLQECGDRGRARAPSEVRAPRHDDHGDGDESRGDDRPYRA